MSISATIGYKSLIWKMFVFNTYMYELKNMLNTNSLQYASWKDFGWQKYTLMMYGRISLQINMFIANDVINTAKHN